MNLVEEITNNFKVQEQHDREVRAKKHQDAITEAAREALFSESARSTEEAARAACAARELDDKARHFSRLQLARLHSSPADQKSALIEEMCAENKRRLQAHQPLV
jgi:hypothetical protein